MVAVHCLPAAPIRGSTTDSIGSLLSKSWAPGTPNKTCPLCLGSFPDKRSYLPSQYGQSSSRCKVTRSTSSTARPNVTFLDSHQLQKSPKCAKCLQSYQLLEDSQMPSDLSMRVHFWELSPELFLVYQSLSLPEVDLLDLPYNIGPQKFGSSANNTPEVPMISFPRGVKYNLGFPLRWSSRS